jgi:hypothetical protein
VKLPLGSLDGTSQSTGWLDRLGVGVGLACAVHCLAMPLLVGVLPLLGLAFVAEERFEWAVIGSIVILATASALWGYQKHRALRVVMSFAGAIGILGLGLWIEQSADWGRYVVILGGLGVATAHLLSARLCSRCEDDEDCC